MVPQCTCSLSCQCSISELIPDSDMCPTRTWEDLDDFKFCTLSYFLYKLHTITVERGIRSRLSAPINAMVYANLPLRSRYSDVDKGTSYPSTQLLPQLDQSTHFKTLMQPLCHAQNRPILHCTLAIHFHSMCALVADRNTSIKSPVLQVLQVLQNFESSGIRERSKCEPQPVQ